MPMMCRRSTAAVFVQVYAVGVFLSLVVSVMCTPVHAHALCKRCDNMEMSNLRQYWINTAAKVSFRTFLNNLLHVMSKHKRLEKLYYQLHHLIRRYDDCLITCEIPFTKRSDVVDFEAHEFLIKLRQPFSGNIRRWLAKAHES